MPPRKDPEQDHKLLSAELLPLHKSIKIHLPSSPSLPSSLIYPIHIATFRPVPFVKYTAFVLNLNPIQNTLASCHPLSISVPQTHSHGLSREAECRLPELQEAKNKGTCIGRLMQATRSPLSIPVSPFPQCDEAVPACSQCINTKRQCPGYVARFDLVLRDQTKAVRRKAQRKNQQQDERPKLPSPPQSASSEDPTSTTWAIVNPGGDPARAVAKRYSSNEPVPRMFNDFPEQQAICAFFLDFVLLPHHPESIEGHLEHLLPLYANTSAESPLSLATSSVALAISGNSPNRRNDQQLGRTIFGKALRKTSAAIRNPTESKKDETLMAVLLLGLFEVRSFTLLALVGNPVSWLFSHALVTLPLI